MGGFSTPLDIRDNGDGTFTVLADVIYEIGEVGTGLVIRVPAGAWTDFASVPRILWPLFPPHGNHGKAAVVHDHLYALVRRGMFTRAIADSIFLEAMKVSGVGFFKRACMYLAVRLFGWMAVKGSDPQPHPVDGQQPR